ncbi:MAG: hypothetical protein GKR93_09055 [Gammaproteobacteria bacterium]|nr:hypothetical protein [Gammaproteobacteria bacterium]
MFRDIARILVCLSSSVLISCSDHETGYYDGYDNVEQQKWLVFGKKDYEDGYKEGQMQAFQDDWYAENEDEMDFSMSCPTIVMRASPVIFTESGRSISF